MNNCFRFIPRAGIYLHFCVQTGSGIHPTSYPTGTLGSSQEINRPKREENSSTSIAGPQYTGDLPLSTLPTFVIDYMLFNEAVSTMSHRMRWEDGHEI
jgi:hypothetical protein